MRLKTVISIIETSTYFMITVALALVFSLFSLRGGGTIELGVSMGACLVLIIAAFFLKLKLVNFYLKRCSYPYEFLSVLEHLGLMGDLEINWSDDLRDGPDRLQMQTGQFLKDNHLATDIGARMLSRSLVLFVWFAILFASVYVREDYLSEDDPLFFIIPSLIAIAGFYQYINSNKTKNDPHPVLSFTEKGLIFDKSLYEWSSIQDWNYIRGRKYSDGRMEIAYIDENNSEDMIVADLDDLKIGHIDLLLLLTHFKAKFG
jgi:hypothetical protein